MTRDSKTEFHRAAHWRHLAVGLAIGSILLAVSACGGSDDFGGTAGSGAPGEAALAMSEEYSVADTAESEAGAEAKDGAYQAVAAGETVSQQATRKLIFRADLQLRVEGTRAAAEDARMFVESRGGFVEQMQVYDSSDGARGNIVLRVPQDAYEETLDHLRAMAVEVLRDESGRVDVTQSYADMNARIENLSAAESELRDLLDEVRETGGDSEDVLAIFREMTNYRGEIDSLQAQLDALSEQIALSTINVGFVPLPAEPRELVERWRPGLVFRRARSDLADALRGLTDAAIYFTVAMAPMLVILLVALWIALWVLRVVVRFFRRDRVPNAASEE